MGTGGLRQDGFRRKVLKGTIYTIMDFPLPGHPTTLFMAGRNCDPSDPFDPFVVESARSSSGTILWKGIDPTPLNPRTRILRRSSFGPMSNANPMGMSTADFNGDGLLDLLVTLDIRHLVLRGERRHIYRYFPGDRDSEIDPLESRMGRQRIGFRPGRTRRCVVGQWSTQ